jgi:hypothetical protein
LCAIVFRKRRIGKRGVAFETDGWRDFLIQSISENALENVSNHSVAEDAPEIKR